MSASTARPATLSPTDAPIGCIIEEGNREETIDYSNDDSTRGGGGGASEGNSGHHNNIVQLWLRQMSPPELQSMQQDDDDDIEDNESHSSSSSSADDSNNDGRVMMALGDLLVADDLGNIGTSRRDLAHLLSVHGDNDNGEIDRNTLEYIRAAVVADDISTSSEEEEVDDDHDDQSAEDEDEDLMLQQCILESMASAKQENVQRHIEDSGAFSPVPSPVSKIDDAAVAVLTLNWADIELDDDEKEESNAELESCRAEKKTLTTCSTAVDDSSDSDVFECPWTAWYDPPKGRTARMGIASDAYEKKLFEMGIVQCPEDFWTVHEMVDWTNMPCGSMVSFSRIGAKPFWEDPMHCQGGRWIIRGFPRSKSESLFTKIALSLFLGHFPDTYEFTCVTLQMKDRRRPNTIQLWTRSVDYAHVEEIQEHICYLVGGWESDGEQPQRAGGRRRGKNAKRSAPPKRLEFEFCPNSESIERNAVKLGDIVATEIPRRTKRNRKAAEVSLASRCHEVSEMYSAGHNRKKSKEKGSKKGCRNNGKVDWSDSLLSMGYRKRRESKDDYNNNWDGLSGRRRFSSCTITPKGTPVPSDAGDALTPEKSRCQDGSTNTSCHFGDVVESLESITAVSDSAHLTQVSSKAIEKDWRSRPATRTAPRSSNNFNRHPEPIRGRNQGSKCLEDSDDTEDWRRSRQRRSGSSGAFIGTDDLECLEANGEEPAFVEFDPRLVGLNWSYGDQSAYYDHSIDQRWEGSNISTVDPYHYYYAHPDQAHFMSISPSCGTFDSHGCWYPPTTTTASEESKEETHATKDEETKEDAESDCRSNCAAPRFLPDVPSSTTIDTIGNSTGSMNEVITHQGSTECILSSHDEMKSRTQSGCNSFDDANEQNTDDGFVSSYSGWQQWGNPTSTYPPSAWMMAEQNGYYSGVYPSYSSQDPYYQQYNQEVYSSQHSTEISRLADSVSDNQHKSWSER